MGLVSWLRTDNRIVYGPRVDDLADPGDGDELPELPELDDDGGEPEGPRLQWACLRCGVNAYAWTVGDVHRFGREHAEDDHPGVNMRIEEWD